MKSGAVIAVATAAAITYLATKKTKTDELKEILLQNNILKKELSSEDKLKLITLLKSVNNDADVKELNKALENITHSDEVDVFALLEDLLTEEEQMSVLKNWQEKGIVNLQTFTLTEDDKKAIEEILNNPHEASEIITKMQTGSTIDDILKNKADRVAALVEQYGEEEGLKRASLLPIV